jgi:hypothetical protein
MAITCLRSRGRVLLLAALHWRRREKVLWGPVHKFVRLVCGVHLEDATNHGRVMERFLWAWVICRRLALLCLRLGRGVEVILSRACIATRALVDRVTRTCVFYIHDFAL